MKNTIIFKGKNSDTIQGLLISELPSIVKPTMRQEVMEVDGRDGEVYRFKGYDSYDRTVEIGLFGEFDIDEITHFFSGEGVAIFSNEPTKKYIARITKQVEFERLIRFRKAKVNFTVQPWKYAVGEQAVESTTSPLTVKNAGYELSKPLIKIEGSAGTETRLSLNGSEFMAVTIPPEGVIWLDSEALNCYNLNADKNQFVKGKFAELVTGNNTITWTGTLTKVTIEPRSRWI